MISKIICPFDFSGAAYNGAEYAAKLASALNFEILFVNVQQLDPVAAAMSMGEGFGSQGYDDSLEVKALESLCRSVKKTFHVPADYHVDVSLSSFTNVVRALDLRKAMIVLGTNGADTFFQELFSSNSYSLVQRASCPVLIVPEGVDFRSISEVVLAWDYAETGLPEVVELLRGFDPKYTFVHVEEKREAYDFEKVKKQLELVRKLAGKDAAMELLPHDEIATALNRYMENGADLLVVPHHAKGLRSQFKLHQHTRALAEHSRFPLLVMPQQ